jgi:anaerobic magnesium-protoporphyrin IX monomethyl ester cyclase
MAEGPRALLVYSAPRSGFGDEWMTFLPIGLGFLQAMLKSRGFACRVANLSGLGSRQILEYFRTQKADVVGVSMFTFNRRRSSDLLRLAREACPSAVLLVGGPHPTHLAREVFEDCPALDAIVSGEGELPLLGVMERLQGDPGGDLWKGAPGLLLREGGRSAVQPPLEDLDLMGAPVDHFEADFLDDVGQLAYLSTSRGCPATCNFCNTPEFWGSAIRFRSAAGVVREMGLLRERHGLTYFSFRDDTFTANKGRTLALMTQIRDSGLHPLWNCQSRVNLLDEDRAVAMKRAGCEFIQFGVEHGSERVLVLLDKGTRMAQVHKAMQLVRRVGMNLGIYLITGIPGETWEDVRQSEALIRGGRPHDVQVSPLALYPGTRLFDQYRAEGRIGPDFYRVSGDAEVFARVDAHTEKSLRHHERVIAEARPGATYTDAEFQEQKAFLGFCSVTNLLYGEVLEEGGRFQEARGEYDEIIRLEAGNPWGFMKRALLRERLGDRPGAREDLREVLALAPGNPEARELDRIWGSSRRKGARKGPSPAHGPHAEMKGAEGYAAAAVPRPPIA